MPGRVHRSPLRYRVAQLSEELVDLVDLTQVTFTGRPKLLKQFPLLFPENLHHHYKSCFNTLLGRIIPGCRNFPHCKDSKRCWKSQLSGRKRILLRRFFALTLREIFNPS